ncbi:LysR family transcriptional regulator [Pedobacter cryoconitis]|uniref:DNA-binding transcriptional LysR family regulator n=1 Tax=Pedobacter cryoconitis TaxID=188932 RepID=A0A7X0MKT3_9SPHI|nr:LysR substrate-binding domain-containing protein [Pedobacter cryoconitis]MBB6501050.1 DNA-binding transcriptional LysR family regulator [Pedobacter cryoconitis]
MDLRHLNYFLVLAEELHFGRAAERLHISQPPLSRMIQQIENDLGVLLFERTKRSVILTPAGSDFLQEAKQMISQMQAVKKRLAIYGKGETGTLRIGYVGAVMHSKLPSLLADFSKGLPYINLRFEELPNHNLVHELNNGTLDVAFVRTWLHPEKLEENLILTEPFIAVLPVAHALAQQQRIAIEDLKQETFITFSRECGPTIFDSFLALCSNAGFSPQISHYASQLNSVLRLVESGFGISLLPEHVEQGYQLNLKFIPLENTEETVPLIMLHRKENPNPALLHLKNHLFQP